MIEQVKDDRALLDLMIADNRSAPLLYQATQFWQSYEKPFLPELYSQGLNNFRKRKNSVLASFGATDFFEDIEIDIRAHRFFRHVSLKIIYLINGFLNRHIPIRRGEVDLIHLTSLYYEFVKMRGRETGAKPIEKLTPSLVGNPKACVVVNEKKYPISILNYYLRYCYCSQFINFETIENITELGSGSGKQIEILKKLHPQLSFFIFDIPPQLYVCEQYLKTIFPNDIVSYREARSFTKTPTNPSGKIFIFGAHQFPILKTTRIDLFWNAASLQEIEPDNAKNYLSIVNEQARCVFLHEWMSGVKQKGSSRLIVQTQLKNYTEVLSNFDMIDISPALIVTKMGRSQNYKDSFWIRHSLNVR